MQRLPRSATQNFVNFLRVSEESAPLLHLHPGSGPKIKTERDQPKRSSIKFQNLAVT